MLIRGKPRKLETSAFRCVLARAVAQMRRSLSCECQRILILSIK